MLDIVYWMQNANLGSAEMSQLHYNTIYEEEWLPNFSAQ